MKHCSYVSDVVNWSRQSTDALELQLRMRGRSEADVMQTNHPDSFAIKVWEGGFFEKLMLKRHAVPSTCKCLNQNLSTN